MCARRFLVACVRPDPAGRRGRLRHLPVGRQRPAQAARRRRGISKPPAAGSGPDYAEPVNWIARPGVDRRSVAMAAGRRDAAAAGRSGDLLHSSDHLSGARPLECAASTRRTDRIPDAAVRAEPGERVQLAPDSLGAALSPGGVSARSCSTARTPTRRSISPIATSPRPSTNSSRQSPATARSSSPGTARARCTCRGCCATRSPASRSQGPVGRRLCRRLAGQHHGRPARARACRLAPRADQAGCILSWHELRRARQPRPDHRRLEQDARARPASDRKREDMLCINPLTGTLDGAAPPPAIPERWCRAPT